MKPSKLIAILFSALVIYACTKEEIKTTYSRQETNIESFVNSMMNTVDTAYVVYNKGVSRLVTVYGQEGDSLKSNGTVSFYYAGYVLTGTSISNSNLFATNSSEIAAAAQWTLSDEDAFEVKTVKLNDKDLVEGLKRGLVGVKPGEECYILFSGKYGFGKRPLGTIPANAALVYHIWVESIS